MWVEPGVQERGWHGIVSLKALVEVESLPSVSSKYASTGVEQGSQKWPLMHEWSDSANGLGEDFWQAYLLPVPEWMVLPATQCLRQF